MNRKQKTDWVVFIVLVGFLAAAAAHYVLGQYVLRGYPFTTFLFAPQDATGFPGQPNIVGVHYFGDFYEAWLTSRGPHPYVDFPLAFPSSYFPVTHIVLFPLAQLPLELALVIYLVAFTALFGVTIFRYAAGSGLDRTKAAIVLTVCSTPVLFLVDRANIEGMLFMLLAGMLFAYRRERFYLAAVILAVPIAMKGSAGVFWLLFLMDGQLRALLVSVATFATMSFTALLILPGATTDNIEGLRSALDVITSAAGEGTFGLRHSAGLKAAVDVLGHVDERLNFFVENYVFLGIAVLLAVAAALAVLRPVLWQRVALVSGAMIIVPSLSYEYRMIHLYLPLLLFLGTSERRRSDALFVVLFGLLLVPKGLPILFGDVNLGTVVNPLLLLVLMAAIVVDTAMDPQRRERLRVIVGVVRRRPPREPRNDAGAEQRALVLTTRDARDLSRC